MAFPMQLTNCTINITQSSNGNLELQNQPPGYDQATFRHDIEPYDPDLDVNDDFDQEPDEPDDIDADYIAYLEDLLDRFPWPPPQWADLDLVPDEAFEFLNTIDFSDSLIIASWERHLRASAAYQAANHRLKRHQGSGFRDSVRRWRCRRDRERAMEAGIPGILMGHWHHTQLEEALIFGVRWHRDLDSFLSESFDYDEWQWERDVWYDVRFYSHNGRLEDDDTNINDQGMYQQLADY